MDYGFLWAFIAADLELVDFDACYSGLIEILQPECLTERFKMILLR